MKSLRDIKLHLQNLNLLMMKNYAQQLKILSLDKIVIARSSIFLKMKEVRKQLQEEFLIFTSVYLMFSLLILSFKAFLSKINELREIKLKLMICKENFYFKLFQGRVYIRRLTLLRLKMGKVGK